VIYRFARNDKSRQPGAAMSLTREEVQKVAHLGRLDLTDAELDAMTRQLGNILDYVEQLKQADTANVEPLAHPLPIQNIFRADEPAASLPVDEALANAPNRKGDFYGVPAVLE
jgi:aspartyl-tRNA(Asn)/glutamyl-tRNA(Gln) amidotransferase subunit C